MIKLLKNPIYDQNRKIKLDYGIILVADSVRLSQPKLTLWLFWSWIGFFMCPRLKNPYHLGLTPWTLTTRWQPGMPWHALAPLKCFNWTSKTEITVYTGHDFFALDTLVMNWGQRFLNLSKFWQDVPVNNPIIFFKIPIFSIFRLILEWTLYFLRNKTFGSLYILRNVLQSDKAQHNLTVWVG